MSDPTSEVLDADGMIEMGREEGTVLRVYDDATGRLITAGSVVVGNPSIGIGRSLNIEGITLAEADALIRDDFAKLVGRMQAFPWWPGLSKVRKFIVCDMAFQMGWGGFMAFAHMRLALAGGEYGQAADAMLNSHWADETPARARRMADAMRAGAFATGA